MGSILPSSLLARTAMIIRRTAEIWWIRRRRRCRHIVLLERSFLLLMFLWVAFLTAAPAAAGTTTTTTQTNSLHVNPLPTSQDFTKTARRTSTSVNRFMLPQRSPSILSFNANAALSILRGGAASTSSRSTIATSTTKRASSSNKRKKKKRTRQSTSTPSDSKTEKDNTRMTAQPQQSSQDSIAVLKVRQIIRSLLDSTHSTGAVHKFIRTLAKWLETLWGTSLLPPPPPKKKKRSASTQTKPKKTNVTPEKKKLPGVTTSTSRTQSSNYRIQRELQAFVQDPPDHLSVKVGKNIRVWIVTLEGLGIYQGETFQLRIAFPANYPLRPPSVYFLPPHIPVHEHVYSNGDICLSLLGKDWRPTMTAQSIAHSILSILASAPRKARPMDNARHAQNKPGEYQEAWVYHDDSC